MSTSDIGVCLDIIAAYRQQSEQVHRDIVTQTGPGSPLELSIAASVGSLAAAQAAAEIEKRIRARFGLAKGEQAA